MKKRILALLLAVCIAASMLVLPASAAATNNTAVQMAITLGAMDTDQTGALNAVVTRGAFARMLTSFSTFRESVGAQGTVGTLYTDVPGTSPWAPYIRIAAVSYTHLIARQLNEDGVLFHRAALLHIDGGDGAGRGSRQGTLCLIGKDVYKRQHIDIAVRSFHLRVRIGRAGRILGHQHIAAADDGRVGHAEGAGGLGHHDLRVGVHARAEAVDGVDADGHGAVSYTHLDVYKRQPHSCR